MAKIEGKLYVGVDWSTGDQVVSLHDAGGAEIGTRTIAYEADALAKFCDELDAMVSGEPERVQVAIETPHGAVVDAMLERGFAVFAINPKQLSRFRDRFTAAGAKDDRRDARVLADSLRTDPRAYRRLEPEAEAIVQLREWSRMLELWDVAPTPARARRVQKATIARILRNNRIRALDAATVLQRLRQSPLVVARGVTEAATAHIRLVIEQLRVVNSQVKRGEQQLDALFKELVGDDEPNVGKRGPHDVEILRSLPGVGRVVLALLLAEGSPCAAAKAGACRCDGPATTGSAKRSTTWGARRSKRTNAPARATPSCAHEATPMAAHCAALPTISFALRARCCATVRSTTPAADRPAQARRLRPEREDLPAHLRRLLLAQASPGRSEATGLSEEEPAVKTAAPGRHDAPRKRRC